jgi:hypothetical protein
LVKSYGWVLGTWKGAVLHPQEISLY